MENKESFVVSARKYRPASFDMVVGQSHITTTLENAIKNNQLAQAFLFCGPRGVGKTTCARILAKVINESADAPASTNMFGEAAPVAMNIFELDAASNNSVDDIRNLIDQVRYPPQTGKYKVYIIDEVHMLTQAAFNAFLKTLEEPPKYAIFILATTEKHKVLPTILSRCQIFDFNRIQISDMADHLAEIAVKENIKAERGALHLIAQKADGALRDALSLFDLIVTFSKDRSIAYKSTLDNLHILDYDYYFKIVENLLSADVPKILNILDEIIKKGFDGHNFIAGLSEHFRNLIVSSDTSTIGLLEVPESIHQNYKDQAKSAGLAFLLSSLNATHQCELKYKSSKNTRLHIELCLIKLSQAKHAIKLSDQIKTLEEELKKKVNP